jgi:hypothetical protein
MKKLNEVVYHRLLLQAQEAKERGLHKMADSVMNSLGPVPEDEVVQYSYSELQKDIHQGVWKLAVNVMKYYDVESVDIERMNDTLETLASSLINNLEDVLDVDLIGPLDPKVPGETK